MARESLLLRAMHLAELVNRAKNTLQKFDLTLNGRNSETKNAKNNPKVPKFLSRAFIHSHTKVW